MRTIGMKVPRQIWELDHQATQKEPNSDDYSVLLKSSTSPIRQY